MTIRTYHIISFVETEAANVFRMAELQTSWLLCCDLAGSVLIIRAALWYVPELGPLKSELPLEYLISLPCVMQTRYKLYLSIYDLIYIGRPLASVVTFYF